MKVGINDVWRSISGRLAEAVPLDEYERTYRTLIAGTRRHLDARLILMEPYVLAPPVHGDPDAVSDMTRQLAQRTYATLRQRGIDSGPEFDAAMVHFRALMEEYIQVVRQLAREHAAVLVRSQAAFDEAMRTRPPASWAADRVHPDASGHAVLARAWLRAVGYGDV